MKLPKIFIKFAFSKYVKKFNKTHRRDKRFVDFNRVRSVLVLFESNLSENHKVVQSIIKDLTNEGKTVVAYGYVPKKKALTPSRLDFTLLDNEKTNCLLRPEKTVLEKIAGEQYDLLIDLTLRQVVPIDYILVSANAKCKTGKKKTETSLTDFQIDIPKRKALPDNEIDLNFCEERLLFDQIIFYLKQITAK